MEKIQAVPVFPAYRFIVPPVSTFKLFVYYHTIFIVATMYHISVTECHGEKRRFPICTCSDFQTDYCSVLSSTPEG
jgi:hypothetical protein